jgi:hypothetical protein
MVSAAPGGGTCGALGLMTTLGAICCPCFVGVPGYIPACEPLSGDFPRVSFTDVVDEVGVPWLGEEDCCPWWTPRAALFWDEWEESFFFEDLFASFALDNCSCTLCLKPFIVTTSRTATCTRSQSRCQCSKMPHTSRRDGGGCWYSAEAISGEPRRDLFMSASEEVQFRVSGRIGGEWEWEGGGSLRQARFTVWRERERYREQPVVSRSGLLESIVSFRVA